MITKPNNLPPKKLENTESLLVPPSHHQKRSPWKKESDKHKPQISLIETENKFELMETESQESPSSQRNSKYPKSLKIRLKSLETIEITESSQTKRQNSKTKTTPNQNKHQAQQRLKRHDP